MHDEAGVGALVVLVRADRGRCRKFLQQRVVGAARHGVHRRADVIEHAHDARWVLRLNQITHDLVVEVLDWFPLDAFLHVLFLPMHTHVRG